MKWYQRIYTINNIVNNMNDPQEHRRTVHNSDPNSAHRAFSSVLLTAQFFGIMPVRGITGHNSTYLRFEWMSLRTLYTCLAVLGTSVITICGCITLLDTSVTVKTISIIVFYGTFGISLLSFLQLATKWPVLIRKLIHVEIAMNTNYGYPKYLAKKIKLWTLVLLTFALVEHILAKVHNLRGAIQCPNRDWLETFFSKYYPFMVVNMTYSPALSVFVLIVDTMATFAWSYIDIFIIAMSVLLTERFKQINMRLETFKQKNTPVRYWREVREDFNSLSYIVKLVDSHINHLVFLSFANNIFFVCLQLLNSTKAKTSGEATLYFYLSFGYLLIRTISVALTAAGINEESKKPRNVLLNVGSESYNIEVQRMLNQVLTDEVALSGLHFFHVTRSLLLTLAGTIVTYEIVLLQLNETSSNEKNIANVTREEFC